MYCGIDLGKTGCRLAVVDERPVAVGGPGAVGLAEPGGVTDAVRAIRAARNQLPDDQRQLSGPLVCGGAGAAAAPDAAAELAARLQAEFPRAQVRVTSDAVIAHAGALGGRSGTVAALGTGAVVINISNRGELRIFGGWGPWLGDDGSGAWIGREALRRVLAARETADLETAAQNPSPSATKRDLDALTAAAERRYGDLAQLPRTLAASGTPARTTAAFASDVLDLATDDQAAREIVQAAALALSATLDRAGGGPVVLTGGLAGAQILLDELSAVAGIEVGQGEGTPLDGALLLAAGIAGAGPQAPHHALLISAEPDPGTPYGGGFDTDPADGRSSGDHGSPADAATTIDVLGTEQVRRDLGDLDTFSATRLVDVLLDAEATVPSAMRSAHGQLATAARWVAQAYAKDGRVVYVGAGTPGRLGALDAAELPPTFGVDSDRFVSVLAGGERALIDAVEGAEDDTATARADLGRLALGPADVVIGIAASGRTPYVIAAIEYARERGAQTIAITNNADTALAAAADHAVELLTGPEVVSGSTRLKAGTSQKVALNIISTAAMILRQKTYGGWMVDLAATNDKLRARAERIVREATGVDQSAAEQALLDTDGQVKTAIVCLLTELAPPDARQRLDIVGGSVRKVLTDQQRSENHQQQDQQDQDNRRGGDDAEH